MNAELKTHIFNIIKGSIEGHFTTLVDEPPQTQEEYRTRLNDAYAIAAENVIDVFRMTADLVKQAIPPVQSIQTNVSEIPTGDEYKRRLAKQRERAFMRPEALIEVPGCVTGETGY